MATYLSSVARFKSYQNQGNYSYATIYLHLLACYSSNSDRRFSVVRFDSFGIIAISLQIMEHTSRYLKAKAH